MATLFGITQIRMGSLLSLVPLKTFSFLEKVVMGGVKKFK